MKWTSILQHFLVCAASGLTMAQAPTAAPDAQKVTDALGSRAQRAALTQPGTKGLGITYGDDVLTDRALCMLSSHRSIAFTSAESTDHVGLGYVSTGGCDREGQTALFLLLDAPQLAGVQMRYRIWISGSSRDIPGPLYMHGLTGGEAQIQKNLDSMIDAPVITGAMLPAWRPGSLEPDLPSSFTWLSGASREQWEAVRSSSMRVWCARARMGGFTCWTPAERQYAALQILDVKANALSACAFTAELVGTRKAISCEKR
jgi:hypothetical protein